MDNEEDIFFAKINLEILKDYIYNLMLINDEICLNVTNNGFYTISFDSSNVSMIKSNLSKDEFEDYLLKEISIKVGLDLLKIYEILNNYNQSNSVAIYINIKKQKLRIHVENMIYTTSLLDLSIIKNDTKELTIQFDNETYIDGFELKKALKIADKINDFIIFEIKEQSLFIKTKNETDYFSLLLSSNVVKKSNNFIISSMYSTEYLLNLSKGIGKLNNIILSIGQDYPLQIKFKLKDKNCDFTYILAPRIESS